MKIKIQGTREYGLLEYLYFFIILLYCSQPHDSIGGLNMPTPQYFVGMTIPFVLTLIILVKYHIRVFDNKCLAVFGIVALWFVVQYFVKGTLNATYTFHMFYKLFVFVAIVKLYGRDIIYLYEHFVYRLTILALIIWVFANIAYGPVSAFFNLFHNSIKGWTEGSCYLYTLMCRQDVLIRNAGFSWEPGRFASFVVLALYIGLAKNKFEIRNIKFGVYTVAVLSTMSTTGIFLYMLILFLWALNSASKARIPALIIAGIAVFYIMQLDFAQEKLMKSVEVVDERADKYGTHNSAYALDRFESLALDFENFIHDPILGCCERRFSYFENLWGIDMYFNNGFAELFAKYGGILALLYLFALFKSSLLIASMFDDKVKISFFLLFIGVNMSYTFETSPLFLAFAFMAYLEPNEFKDESLLHNE